MYDEDDQLSQQTAQAAADARKARDAGRQAVGDWLGKMPAVSALGVELTTEQIQLWLNEWLVSHNALQALSSICCDFLMLVRNEGSVPPENVEVVAMMWVSGCPEAPAVRSCSRASTEWLV